MPLVCRIVRNYCTVARKRITRIPSEFEVSEEEVNEDSTSPNDKVPIRVVNRNPRNLEQLNFEPKPNGWQLDAVHTNYWNQAVLDKSSKSLTGKIVHHSGKVLVTASTNEPWIKLRINSTSDVMAASLIGQILAKRCFESGIIFAAVNPHKTQEVSPKTKAFFESLQANGVCLREPHVIFPRRRRDL